MPYLGKSPLGGFESPAKDSFSGDNSTTSFTMSRSVAGPSSIDVFVDNVRQEPTTAYTVSDKAVYMYLRDTIKPLLEQLINMH